MDTTRAPALRAWAAVASELPSSTTMISWAIRPLRRDSRTFRTTSPTAFSSLKAGIRTVTGSLLFTFAPRKVFGGPFHRRNGSFQVHLALRVMGFFMGRIDQNPDLVGPGIDPRGKGNGAVKIPDVFFDVLPENQFGASHDQDRSDHLLGVHGKIGRAHV